MSSSWVPFLQISHWLLDLWDGGLFEEMQRKQKGDTCVLSAWSPICPETAVATNTDHTSIRLSIQKALVSYRHLVASTGTAWAYSLSRSTRLFQKILQSSTSQSLTKFFQVPLLKASVIQFSNFSVSTNKISTGSLILFIVSKNKVWIKLIDEVIILLVKFIINSNRLHGNCENQGIFHLTNH